MSAEERRVRWAVTGRTESPRDFRWAEQVARVEDAVVGGDATAMLRTWQAACLEALGSQQWEPMIAVGDAALRVGRATGFTIAFEAKARQAYHVALFRAHKQVSLEGIRRAAGGFDQVGDREVAEQALRLAQGLAERHGLGAPRLP
ncbi:MAG: hypothetical protein AUH29_13145 [Candidatus Rokubacteria bacterium 13_1_40CM_69_27]|nr:MAG: hypothetical protein AUH29_13145 [Candidatus Rokubacteria bacterium 13_1_40CM_69_27]OLC30895.1 MAG: hypothetical protein AUH81_19020 [Candidatus Rokubacteria bacterium 13_1_40CM_4_69_5]OLE38127.1 MAG: hypothetical protein AUG00_06350 [Candidatus Rokubacteria bacterium 13_1_20CM_2_70_7]